MATTIKFTLQLTPETMRAFRDVERCDNGVAVKDLLVEMLRDRVDKVVNDDIDLRDGDDEDDDGEED